MYSRVGPVENPDRGKKRNREERNIQGCEAWSAAAGELMGVARDKPDAGGIAWVSTVGQPAVPVTGQSRVYPTAAARDTQAPRQCATRSPQQPASHFPQATLWSASKVSKNRLPPIRLHNYLGICNYTVALA